MSEVQSTADLLGLLGEPDFIRLVDAYGGTRLYIPTDIDASAVVDKLGRNAAEKLSQRYARTYIRVPLARELRARHYRAVLGWSNAQIAVRLGLTEPGVDGLFRRMPGKPVKGSRDPRQPDLFS